MCGIKPAGMTETSDGENPGRTPYKNRPVYIVQPSNKIINRLILLSEIHTDTILWFLSMKQFIVTFELREATFELWEATFHFD